MIKLVFTVDYKKIRELGPQGAFCEELVQWEVSPCVKFLRQYGKITSVDFQKTDITNIYTTIWELPPEKETWFRLQYYDLISNET